MKPFGQIEFQETMKSYLQCSKRRRKHSAPHAASRTPSGRRCCRSQAPGFRCGTGRPRGSPCSSRSQVRSRCRGPCSGPAVPGRTVRTAEAARWGRSWRMAGREDLYCYFFFNRLRILRRCIKYILFGSKTWHLGRNCCQNHQSTAIVHFLYHFRSTLSLPTVQIAEIR